MIRERDLVLPDWPAPATVRAVATTRHGGRSAGDYASLNLGINTRDDPETVAANRRLLSARLGLGTPPVWLRQVHGRTVVKANTVDAATEADASWTDTPGVTCAVLTADCLPILFCNVRGTRVAAVHGGWRGLAAGIIEKTLAVFDDARSEVLAWLGPAIGPEAFEVGLEVRAAFVSRWPETTQAFLPGNGDRWWCDIGAIARIQLAALGVDAVHGGGFCTFSDEARFYSYRRDGETGRQASLIWLDGK